MPSMQAWHHCKSCVETQHFKPFLITSRLQPAAKLIFEFLFQPLYFRIPVMPSGRMSIGHNHSCQFIHSEQALFDVRGGLYIIITNAPAVK